MKLDSEQKKIGKVVLCTSLGATLSFTVCGIIFGRLTTVKDILLSLLAGLITAAILTAFYVLGSRIPKKDK